MFKRKSREEKENEVKALIENAEKKIDEYFDSPESIKEYLSFMSKFYNYSVNNTILIDKQFSGATAVGSFAFWKEKGFTVNKGEKGIRILVPNKGKDRFENEKGEIKTVDKATDEEKEKIKKGILEVHKGKLFFTQGYVFDISQTNAKASDLPKIFPNRWLEGTIPNYETMYKGMEKIADNIGVKIIEPKHELGAAKGVSYPLSKEVALNPRNSELQNVKTLLHELTHAKLHTADNLDKLKTHEKEFQAELTAYTVCNHFGIDTSDYSLQYLNSWIKGKELNDKKELLKEVRETAVEYIETLENVLLDKEHLQEIVINENRENVNIEIEEKKMEMPISSKNDNTKKSLKEVEKLISDKENGKMIFSDYELESIVEYSNKVQDINKVKDYIDYIADEHPGMEFKYRLDQEKVINEHKELKEHNKSKDDDFMKEYLEQQKRKSMAQNRAKEKSKDIER